MRDMRRLYIYIFLLIIAGSVTQGQDVKVTSSFDSTRIYIGDQIKFTVVIDQPSDIRLNTPVFKDTLIKKIEILSGPVVDSSAGKDKRIRITQKYLITSFDSGKYQVPPVFAELKNEAGIKRFYSDYSRLEVMRLKIAPADTTAKIYDIIQPYRAPVTLGEILPWVLLIVVIGAIVWFIIRYIKNHKKVKSGIAEIVIREPAHIIAFRDLEKLDSEKLWQKDEIKNYYTKLTEILRQYLENRYGVYSLELTTTETLDALLRTGFKKDASFSQLKTVLTGADLVKFAKYKPEPVENESHFKNSWDFVERTKEADVLPDGNVKNDMEEEGSL
jgi:hypothetical protein